MRKVLLAVSALAAIVVAVMIVNPGARTKWYFSLERQWTAHWPLTRGRSLPMRFKPLIRPTAPAWVEVEPHVTMLLDPEDYVSAEILRTGAWETESWQTVRQHLSPGAVFVDVGAHIGYYALKAAAVVGPEGRVIAVEPNPPTVKELRDNIAASGATAVHVQPVACADAEGTLDLFAAPRANTGQSSLSRANAAQKGAVAEPYHVRARTLDAIIDEEKVARVDVIKVDVEGAETLVLKGAGATLDRFHPVVIVEIIEQQLRQMGTTPAEIRALLAAHGYAARGELEDNVEFVWSGRTAR